MDRDSAPVTLHPSQEHAEGEVESVADWQLIVLFLLVVFVLTMRNRPSGPPQQRSERRESWGQRLNRKAANPFDTSDPFATQLRKDREQVNQIEITGPEGKSSDLGAEVTGQKNDGNPW